jgi:hypothetical protein
MTKELSKRQVGEVIGQLRNLAFQSEFATENSFVRKIFSQEPPTKVGRDTAKLLEAHATGPANDEEVTVFLLRNLFGLTQEQTGSVLKSNKSAINSIERRPASRHLQKNYPKIVKHSEKMTGGIQHARLAALLNEGKTRGLPETDMLLDAAKRKEYYGHGSREAYLRFVAKLHELEPASIEKNRRKYTDDEIKLKIADFIRRGLANDHPLYNVLNRLVADRKYFGYGSFSVLRLAVAEQYGLLAKARRAGEHYSDDELQKCIAVLLKLGKGERALTSFKRMVKKRGLLGSEGWAVFKKRILRNYAFWAVDKAGGFRIMTPTEAIEHAGAIAESYGIGAPEKGREIKEHELKHPKFVLTPERQAQVTAAQEETWFKRIVNSNKRKNWMSVPNVIEDAAMDGLIHAVANFNPSMGVKLSTFASHRIQGEIKDRLEKERKKYFGSLEAHFERGGQLPAESPASRTMQRAREEERDAKHEITSGLLSLHAQGRLSADELSLILFRASGMKHQHVIRELGLNVGESRAHQLHKRALDKAISLLGIEVKRA